MLSIKNHFQKIIIFLFVSSFTTLQAQHCVTPPDHMIGWWPLDQHANDLINGNNGALFGAGGTYTPGRVLDGFASAGTNGLIEVPHHTSLNVSDFSIDAWINIHAVNTFNMPIVWKGDPTGANVTTSFGFMVFGTNSPNAGRLGLLISDGTNFSMVVSNAVLPVSTDLFVVGTSIGGIMELYVNGALVGQITNAGTVQITPHPLQIGGVKNPVINNFFNGVIDEVELFDAPLSLSDIQGIYNAGKSGKCKELCEPQQFSKRLIPFTPQIEFFGRSVLHASNCHYYAGGYELVNGVETMVLYSLDGQGVKKPVFKYAEGSIEKIVEAENGDLIVSGYRHNTVNDLMLMRLTANGNVIWSREFSTGQDLRSADVVECHNGDIVVGGNGYDDVYVARVTSAGGPIWGNRFRDVYNNPFTLEGLEQVDDDGDHMVDDGFVFVGNYDYHNGYIGHLDPGGSLTWISGLVEPTNDNLVYDVKQIDSDADGFLNPQAYAVTGGHGLNMFLATIQNNITIQANSFNDASGGQVYMYGQELVQMTDGSLTAAGYHRDMSSVLPSGFILNATHSVVNRSLLTGTPTEDDQIISMDLHLPSTIVFTGHSDLNLLGTNHTMTLVSQDLFSPYDCENLLNTTSGLPSFSLSNFTVGSTPIQLNATAIQESQIFPDDDIYCNSTSQKRTLGIELERQNQFKVYPNPAKEGESWNVEWSAVDQIELSILVHSADGKVIYDGTKTLERGMNKWELNGLDTKPGLYHITFKLSEEVYHQKVIIESD